MDSEIDMSFHLIFDCDYQFFIYLLIYLLFPTTKAQNDLFLTLSSRSCTFVCYLLKIAISIVLYLYNHNAPEHVNQFPTIKDCKASTSFSEKLKILVLHTDRHTLIHVQVQKYILCYFLFCMLGVAKDVGVNSLTVVFVSRY